jgi:hypothetical protein
MKDEKNINHHLAENNEIFQLLSSIYINWATSIDKSNYVLL